MKKIFKKSAKFSLKGIDLTQYILTRQPFAEEESRPYRRGELTPLKLTRSLSSRTSFVRDLPSIERVKDPFQTDT